MERAFGEWRLGRHVQAVTLARLLLDKFIGEGIVRLLLERQLDRRLGVVDDRQFAGLRLLLGDSSEAGGWPA